MINAKDTERLEEIVALERQRTLAWIGRDTAGLASLLHEDYVEINVFGRFTKREVLEKLFPAHELLSYQTSDHRLLRTAAADVCVLCYRVEETLRGAGETQPQSYTCNVSALYERSPAGWLLRLWQITPLTE